ncbi:MAG: hypothetical protein AAF513_02740 [Pseudomonadota bacterium]
MDDLNKSLPDAVSADAIEALTASEDMTKQLAMFTQAGFNFFRPQPSFQTSTLNQRRASGGNGAVLRVMQRNDAILLETMRLIVGFEDGVDQSSQDDVLQRFQLVKTRDITIAGATQCVSAKRTDILELCVDIMEEDFVAYAERDFIQALPARHTPGDPEFAAQWHHQNIASPQRGILPLAKMCAWLLSTMDSPLPIRMCASAVFPPGIVPPSPRTMLTLSAAPTICPTLITGQRAPEWLVTDPQGLDVPLFWACTNGNYPIASDEICAHPRVIAVGRSDQDHQDNGSGYGPELELELEFLAPGVDVWLPTSAV